MSTVTTRVIGNINGPRAQAHIVVLGSSPIVLPITSPTAVYDNLESNWQQVPRPGLKPINQRVGGNLTTAQYTVTLVGSGGGPWDLGNQVEPVIKRLAAMAKADTNSKPIAMVWGGFDGSSQLTSSGHWHISAMTITSSIRQPGTNNISQASMNITLTEASDLP